MHQRLCLYQLTGLLDNGRAKKDSEEECRPGGEENDSLMFQYNEALSRLSEKVRVGNFTPLTFQLNTTWEEATQEEKEICIDKAMEGCKIVCEVIAPKAGDELEMNRPRD